jgi:hypothetical protein
MLVAVIALLLKQDGATAAVAGLVAGLVFFVFITTVLVRWAMGYARSMPSMFPRPAGQRAPPEA